jgi:hypothetical protein
LVRDGQPVSMIVTADNPSPATLTGASLLAAQIKRISGATLPVVKEGALGDAKVADGSVRAPGRKWAEAFALVGPSRLAKSLGSTPDGLGPGGILIRTTGNALVLLGPDAATPSDPNGTRYAVTTFLEDALGFRFLWPGELGLVAPARKTITVDGLDRSFTPLIAQRQIRNARYNDRTQAGLDFLGIPKATYGREEATIHGDGAALPGWFEWQRLGGNIGLVGGHAFGYVWDKYHQEHPEWFAMQPNGSRDLSKLGPARARLCKSNLGLIDALAQDKIAELEQRHSTSVSLAPNDGGPATFCMCPECKKLDPPNGRPITLWDNSSGARHDFQYVSLTDRMVWFWNQLATRITAKHPEATLTVYAYSAYEAPPMREKLHPSLAVGFTGITYTRDEMRQQALADWDAWSKATKKLYWRPNLLLFARREGTPSLYAHKLGEDLHKFAHHSLLGTDFDSCMHHWSTEGLNYYVLARLLWNPDASVDEILDDYCRAGFGQAAPEIRKYLARLEQLTNRIAAEKLGPTEPYTPETVAELGHILDAAAKAEDDETIRRRIASLRRGLDFTALQNRTHAFLTRAAEQKPTPAEREQIKALEQEKWQMMRRILREDPLAVNVAMVAWGSEASFGKYGWAGAKSVTPDLLEADEQGRPVNAGAAEKKK